MRGYFRSPDMLVGVAYHNPYELNHVATASKVENELKPFIRNEAFKILITKESIAAVPIITEMGFISEPFAGFHLDFFPGFCAAAILTGVYVKRGYTRAGLGTKLHELAILYARQLGYTKLIATDQAFNVVELHILKKVGFEPLTPVFRSVRTGNEVQMFIKDLRV